MLKIHYLQQQTNKYEEEIPCKWEKKPLREQEKLNYLENINQI